VLEPTPTIAPLRPWRESLADRAAYGDQSGSPDCLLVHAASVVQPMGRRHYCISGLIAQKSAPSS
jgi:hypothetical protein